MTINSDIINPTSPLDWYTLKENAITNPSKTILNNYVADNIKELITHITSEVFSSSKMPMKQIII